MSRHRSSSPAANCHPSEAARTAQTARRPSAAAQAAHDGSLAPPVSPPPDEATGDKYLTLIEHLQELRYRVVMMSIGVVIGLMISAIFADDFIEFLKQPAEDKSENFQLQFIEPFENFVVYFKVALLGGLVLGMPMIVYHGLKFVSPGLRGRNAFGSTARSSARPDSFSPA